MRRGLGGRCAAVAIGVTLATVGCASAEGPDPEALGYRAGGGLFRADRFLAAEEWLGRQINYTVQFAGRQSQRDMNGSVFGLVADDSATLPDFADRVDLSITVPLAFGRATPRTIAGRDEIRRSLLDVTAGEHDSAYRRLARRLVDAGFDDAIVRLGHEFNGAWAPWSSRTNEEEFIAAWRHVHGVMREEAPGLRFEWTAIRPAWFEWAESAYPGDDVVDIIGLDVYWRATSNGDPWDRATWERDYGRVLRDHHSFAVVHGKPVAYPEWGLTGADVPQFVEAMYEWLTDLPYEGPGGLLYHAYFDDNGEYSLDQYPRSNEAFRRLFGEE